MPDNPRFWGSWKGQIVKAVCVDEGYTWEEIREKTGLSPVSLNKGLAELFELELITKNDKEEYRVDYDLYKEYVNYFKQQKPNNTSGTGQSQLIDRVEQWLEFNELNYSLGNKHFYLDGEHLDSLATDLIKNATGEVLVVNPFVDRCNLTESLLKAQVEDRSVTLLTRQPKNNKRNKKKLKYHNIIKTSEINFYYNDVIHAKLVVVDRTAAIVSSMNLYSGSTAGSSWEAGIITLDNQVVNNIIESINGIIKRKETVKQT